MNEAIQEPTTLEEYFLLHPDEEDSFYDDMATLANYEEQMELPEDWVC